MFPVNLRALYLWTRLNIENTFIVEHLWLGTHCINGKSMNVKFTLACFELGQFSPNPLFYGKD